MRSFFSVLTTGVFLAFFTAGCGSAGASEETDRKPTPVSTVYGFVYTDVTEEAGLGDYHHVKGAYGEVLFPESMGSGGGFIDYDGDGWEDIILAGGGVFPKSTQKLKHVIWLYRNNGDGTFSLKTEEAGLGDLDAYSLGVTAADYDNDGDQDVYLTNLYENMLFRNDGGVFTEVGEEAGVKGPAEWSASAMFFDADRDGWSDLWVGNYVEWSVETDIYCSLNKTEKGYCTPEIYTPLFNRFYHNNGDGTFTEWTEKAGFVPSRGKNLGVAEFDYNRDGWPDVVVANDTQPNLLFENNGDGTFTERGAISGIAYDEHGRTRAGMGVDTGVIDDTGEESIVIANFSNEMVAVYRYAGGGLFDDVTKSSGVGQTSFLTLAFGIFLFDVDLDGDLDLFCANGHVQPQIEETTEGVFYEEPPHLFLNDGNAKFKDVAPEIGGVLSVPMVSRGAAYADYDRDGDIDILVTQNDGRAFLLRNDLQNDHHFLRVSTVGRNSNRDGLGTQIAAKVGDRTFYRRVRTGSSYQVVNEKTVTFGLGTAGRVDSLIVRWPSGQVDRFAGIEANHEIVITEGEPQFVRKPRRVQSALAQR